MMLSYISLGHNDSITHIKGWNNSLPILDLFHQNHKHFIFCTNNILEELYIEIILEIWRIENVILQAVLKF